MVKLRGRFTGCSPKASVHYLPHDYGLGLELGGLD